MEQVRMHWNDLKAIQLLLNIVAETYEDGAWVGISDRNKIIYRKNDKFDIAGTEVGSVNKTGGVADMVIRNPQVQVIPLDPEKYGTRGNAYCGPIWNDQENDVMGVWMIVTPKFHKMEHSFEYFAPIIANVMPEGAFMYITNKDKFVRRQGSDKFDIPDVKIGIPLKESDLAVEAMRTGKNAIREMPRTIWGKDVLVSCYPLADEDNKEVVGAFGLALPREMALELKEMSNNLGRGLSEVSAAMEEIAASASEVSQNQIVLNQEIELVYKNTNEIYEVLAFIKEIADETKMLGLNAAIEAARAGEAGRGFGVVAEEIRKLSDQSKQTVVQIKELLERVHSSIQETVKVSDATLNTTEQVAAATEEVNASIEEMSSLAVQLDSTAAKM